MAGITTAPISSRRAKQKGLKVIHKNASALRFPQSVDVIQCISASTYRIARGLTESVMQKTRP